MGGAAGRVRGGRAEGAPLDVGAVAAASFESCTTGPSLPADDMLGGLGAETGDFGSSFPATEPVPREEDCSANQAETATAPMTPAIPRSQGHLPAKRGRGGAGHSANPSWDSESGREAPSRGAASAVGMDDAESRTSPAVGGTSIPPRGKEASRFGNGSTSSNVIAPLPNGVIASASFLAEGHRSGAGLRKHRVTASAKPTGRSGSRWRMGTGSLTRVAVAATKGAAPLGAKNACLPVSMRYKMIPIAQISVCGQTASPRSCSGAMYLGVPNTSDSAVSSALSECFEMPKSTILTTSSGSTRKMFAGLRSRWMIPRSCAS